MNIPGIYHRLKQLYQRGGADKPYKEKLYSEFVNPLREQYGIPNSYTKPMREKMRE